MASGATASGCQDAVDPQWPFLRVTRREGFAVVAMAKEPVNSLNLEMWQQLEAVLDSLEADATCQGLILTTALKRDVFTAGNDLLELFAPRTSAARYAEFWVTSNRFLCKLHRSRLATIAAIRGACPAGGCMMAMCCDHRVMTAGGTMGLNEVQLGIPVPKYWALLMTQLVGAKAADKMLLTGKMIPAAEAKTLGLVDAVVDKDGLLAATEKVMAQLVKLPPAAVAATKLNLRADFCNAWAAYFQQEAVVGWQQLTQPETVRVLEGALARLSSSSAAKAAAARAEPGNNNGSRPKL